MSRFDPREWTHQRLTFSASKVLGQVLLTSEHETRTNGYEEAVLIRKPGRNGFEVFTVMGLLAVLYGSAVLALVESAAGTQAATLAFMPLLPFVTLAITLAQIILGGLVGFVAERLPVPIDRLRASGFAHLVIATLTASLLALNEHWTRWVGIIWFALTALNLLSGLIILLLRSKFRSTSDKAWRNTQYVD